MFLHITCISVCGCRRRRNAKKTRGITILANVRLNTQRWTVTTKHNNDSLFANYNILNIALYLCFWPSQWLWQFCGKCEVRWWQFVCWATWPIGDDYRGHVTALRQSQLTWPSARGSRRRSCWGGPPRPRRPGAGPGCRGNTWPLLPCLCKGQAPSLSRVTCGHVIHVAVGCSWIVIIQNK